MKRYLLPDSNQDIFFHLPAFYETQHHFQPSTETEKKVHSYSLKRGLGSWHKGWKPSLPITRRVGGDLPHTAPVKSVLQTKKQGKAPKKKAAPLPTSYFAIAVCLALAFLIWALPRGRAPGEVKSFEMDPVLWTFHRDFSKQYQDMQAIPLHDLPKAPIDFSKAKELQLREIAAFTVPPAFHDRVETGHLDTTSDPQREESGSVR